MKAGQLIQFFFAVLGWIPLLTVAALGQNNTRDRLKECPGYKVTRISRSDSYVAVVYINLELAGPPCNVYGKDHRDLTLKYFMVNSEHLHLQIFDGEEQAFQVPEYVFPRARRRRGRLARQPLIRFDYTENPFSFRILRSVNDEVLFDSSAAGLVFEDQYIRLRTSLPLNPNLYGLGEHSDSFRLQNNNYTRTLWNADTPSVPSGWNLYGSHPFYMEHRGQRTHGVFLLNANGMDIVIDNDPYSAYLEYNIIGGILDFHFFAGETPLDVVRQYATVTQTPAPVPYSSLGFHQCRWGYQDVFNVAEVVHNYSQAGIPLEAMWTDIDYMDGRAVFTLDPERFPLSKMRQLVDHLHAKNQKFVLMVDPAVPVRDYGPYNNGNNYPKIFLVNSTGLPFQGVVWPGLAVYPDWFAYGVQDYWNREFTTFFNPLTGIDIDFLWIDMNEPSNFCDFPCTDVEDVALLYPPPPPPVRSPPRELPGWPCSFQPPGTNCSDKQDAEKNGSSLLHPRQQPDYTDEYHRATYLYPPDPGLVLPRIEDLLHGQQKPKYQSNFLGQEGRDLINPPYTINNAWGPLPQKSLNTSIIHYNGLALYDTHNLYGTMMASASRNAMLFLRPSKRPFVLTRSTFAGSGTHSAHWLGDNDSSWEHYRLSIRQMLQFNSLFQVPMVGSDVCGFNGNTTEELCARWAMLGAFQPFYRNHNAEGQADQEFYRWPSVTKAAKKAIDLRYRLLDYFYTALMDQSSDGTPSVNPMFFFYPRDENTWALELQYFWGPALLVAPVTKPGTTSVKIYFPKDIFYDFYTHEQFYGVGKYTTKRNQTITDIPLYIRGGQIIPMRTRSAMTTADLRKQDFELVIALNAKGRARGKLFLDDGESLLHSKYMIIEFSYSWGRLHTKVHSGGYKTQANIVKVTIMGGARCPPGQSSCSKDLHHPISRGLSLKI